MSSISPGTRIGPYEIDSLIGAGGMGEVYRAHDARLARSVAIKVLPASLFRDETALLRFEREAKATAAVSHPNLISIHDVGHAGDFHYIVMDLLEGETLRRRLERGAVRWPEAVDLMILIAGALDAVHARGFVHRDIKPENIFVTSDGWLKVLDFGLAVPIPAISDEADRDSTVAAITRKGAFVGTLAYMSPEQLAGEDVDRRADLFACGCVLYELLTGCPAFRRSTPVETISAIVAGDEVRIPPTIPVELARVVRQSLERRRDRRFQSAAQFRAALQGIADDKPSARDRRDTRHSIAVLPLANLSAHGEDEYFADGITEELIHELARVPGLQVASRTSAFAYKGKTADIRTIAAQLAVSTILEGSIRRFGDRVRVSTQLVNAADGYQLWSDRFDRELKDIFAIQDEITAAVVGRLRATLGDSPLHSRHPLNVDAYTKYLRGLFERNRAVLDAFPRAIGFYQQAIEAEPRYALAHSAMAIVYTDMANFGLFKVPTETWEDARTAAERALSIDERLAEAHTALAWVHLCADWNWQSAESHLRRAIELEPESVIARHLFAHYLTATGRYEEAREESELFHRLAPLDPHAAAHLIFDALFAGDLARAIESGERFCEFYPDAPIGRVYLGMAYLRTGRAAEAAREFAAVFEATQSSWALSNLARAHAAAGRIDEATRILDELVERRSREYVQAYDIAVVHLALGRNDEALVWLQKAANERNHWVVYISIDATFDGVRGTSQFREVNAALMSPSLGRSQSSERL